MPKEKKIKEKKIEQQPAQSPVMSVDEDTARIVAEHHFQKTPKEIKQLTGGLANFVYEVDMGDGNQYVIRISDLPMKLNYFIKEQWAVAQARSRGVPTPEILEVGNEVIPAPYMIVRKVEGTPALAHPDRMKILAEMGKYTAVINTIPTTGFGHVFDWSNNTLSKRDTWKDFMEKEWNIPQKLEIFEKNQMFTKENFKKIKEQLKDLETWDKSSTLNHGDIRLKNVLVDKDGKIVAILDWENCASLMSPHWDLSLALHDLNIDEKQVFLDGYGIRVRDFQRMAPRIKLINLMNYAPFIQQLADSKDEKTLEKYRSRLNGDLDLYSVM